MESSFKFETPMNPHFSWVSTSLEGPLVADPPRWDVVERRMIPRPPIRSRIYQASLRAGQPLRVYWTEYANPYTESVQLGPWRPAQGGEVTSIDYYIYWWAREYERAWYVDDEAILEELGRAGVLNGTVCRFFH